MNHQHQRVRQLHDEFFWLLVQFAQRFLPSEADAEDAVQDIFVKLCISCPEFTGYQHAFRLLHIAVKNRCIDFKRHKSVRERFEDYLLNHQETAEGGLTDEEEGEWLIHEWLQKVSSLMEELPPRSKLIFMARLYHQKTNGEIAEELGISKATVRNQVSLAIQKLKELLSRGSSSLGLFHCLLLFCLCQFLKMLLFIIQYH